MSSLGGDGNNGKLDGCLWMKITDAMVKTLIGIGVLGLICLISMVILYIWKSLAITISLKHIGYIYTILILLLASYIIGKKVMGD